MAIIKKFFCMLLLSAFFANGIAYASNAPDSPEINEVQQQGRLTGTVTDEDGAVIGASVAVKGTTTGTVTDINGKFTLNNVPRNATIVISYIGYIPQEIKYTGQNNLDIRLEVDATMLQETVVTGYGIARDKKTLGYAVSSIKGDELTLSGITSNPLAAIYGKAAGVGVAASSSGPTGGINIKIRGASHLDSGSNTRPLFVVDGVPIYDTESSMATRGYDPYNSFDYGSGINDINPEDIESMEILKGAKATVLYGSNAANGVVLITTKKGQGTRGLGVQLAYRYEWQEPVNYIDFQNEYGSGTSPDDLKINENRIVSSSYNWGPKFDGSEIEYWDGSKRKYQPYKNNYDDIWSTGGFSNLTIALQGGNEKGNMRLSYTNSDYSGIIENHYQRKHSFSFAGQMNVSKLTKLEVTTNLYKVKTQNRYPNVYGLMSAGINRDYDYQTLADSYINEEGYKNIDVFNSTLPKYQKELAELLWRQKMNRNIDDKTHLISTVSGTFQLHPLFALKTMAGIDFTQTDYTRKEKVTAVEPEIAGGKYRFDTNQNQIFTLNAMLTFDKSFINDRLRITAFAAGEYKGEKGYDIYASTFGPFNNPDWYALNNMHEWPSFDTRGHVYGHSRYRQSTYSAFGNVTASWDDKYYLEISGRNDWTSILQRGNNSYFYPGISFNWNFDQDINQPWLNYGNLRVSWADVGRPGTRYFSNNILNMGTIGNSDIPSVEVPNSLFSGVIKPERKRELEFGLDARFFDLQRLQVDFSYYTGNTYDMIMAVPLTPTTGFGSIRINAGKVKHWGYELMLKGAILADKKKTYRWDIGVNFANQFSKVESLYPGITEIVTDPGRQGWSIRAKEGERTNQIWATDYLRDDNGNRIVGDDGLYTMNPDEKISLGNSQPDIMGGIFTDFYYKNFNVHVGLDFSYGGRVISMSNYYLLASGTVKETLANRDESKGGLAYYIADGKKIKWEHNKATPNGETLYHDGMILNGVMWDEESKTYVKNENIGSTQSYWRQLWHDNDNSYLQPDFIYKNNYIKLREISLAYTLPKKISDAIKLQKVTFSLTARNLFYLYKSIKNIDSEGTQGTNTIVEYSNFPTQRSWGFGVNVSF